MEHRAACLLSSSLQIVEGPYDNPVPGPSGMTEPGPSIKRPKLKVGKVEEEKKHYKKQSCPICRVSVVHLRHHLISIHSIRNERIPMFKVEALIQAARHGKQLHSGQVQNKNKDGTIRLTTRSKEVCPICESVPCYLSTHLQ